MFLQAGRQQGCLTVSRGMPFPFSLANQCAGWLADLQVSPAQNTWKGLKGKVQAFLQTARSNKEVGTNLCLLGKQKDSSSQFGHHVAVPARRLALAGAVPCLWLCQQLRHLFTILAFRMAQKELQEGAGEES